MSPLNISIIIQARLGSARLPGKVLKELLPGRSMLSLTLERMRRSRLATQIIVATSDKAEDRAIVAEARKSECDSFCGSEEDVLGRFVAAAKAFNSDVIVRLCADSPIHDPQIVDACIDVFVKHQRQVDYVSNLMPESFPYGTAVEVFPLDVLLRIDRLTTDQSLREHVTPYIHRHPELFKVMNVQHVENLSHLRWAVDHAEDFELAQSIYNRFYERNPQFSWLDVIDTARNNV